ncbi:MAG TPA: hypothetical protein VMV69_15960 [Pirellulales bacterium]|nr:hypothetical protein [Pirellulales bacterium]
MARETTVWGSDVNSGAGSLDIVILAIPKGREFTPEELAAEVRRRGLPERRAVREHLVNREKMGVVEKTPNGWKRIAGGDAPPLGVIPKPISVAQPLPDEAAGVLRPDPPSPLLGTKACFDSVGANRPAAHAAIVNLSCFPAAYLDKADQIFPRPTTLYSWDKIISGAAVKSASGATRRMFAVGQNTFRGFHRRDKACPGAKEAFIKYFVDERSSLVEALSAVRTRDELHGLSNTVCDGIRSRLGNVVPTQLRAYNKVRKPVDLYFEHLVSMAAELDHVRAALVPLLFLPLDSQILAHSGLFSEQELAMHGLSRTSTYKDVVSERTYSALQSLLVEKAGAVAAERRRSFHPIYFDLVWNDRYRNWGGNLFETNP